MLKNINENIKFVTAICVHIEQIALETSELLTYE